MATPGWALQRVIYTVGWKPPVLKKSRLASSPARSSRRISKPFWPQERRSEIRIASERPPRYTCGVMAALVERRLFTRQEYHTMLRAGILTEDDPVELLQGEIVQKMPSGPSHASTIKRLNRLL